MVNKKENIKFPVFFPLEKKGWLKIVEVFIAILLITGVVLMIIEKEDSEINGSAEKIYEKEISILREIKLNNTLRNEILSASIPTEWENFDTELSSVKEKINSKIPDYLECKAKLCKIEGVCSLGNSIEKDIYSKSTAIFVNLTEYNPRQLKLFCWEK